MKRLFPLLFCLLMGMAGCSSPAPSDAPPVSSDEPPVALANPMHPRESPDFTDPLGFEIGAFPTLDDTVTLERCWLIADEVAQLDLLFTDGQEGTLRVARDAGEDISGVYSQFEKVRTETVGVVEVEISESTNGGPALLRWLENGYRFTLYFPAAQTELVEQTAAAFPGNIPLAIAGS